MNRTRLFVALLGVLFTSAVGVGAVVGDEDPPDRLVAAADVEPSTTTTAVRSTTTASTSTTTVPTTSTTVAPTTSTSAPRSSTSAPPTTAPATTQPPATAPPTTQAPPTTPAPTSPPPTAPPFDNAFCSSINAEYLQAGTYGDPSRLARLKGANCPERYWG